MASSIDLLLPLRDPPDATPWGALVETLLWGLRDAGYDASLTSDKLREHATPIVLCPHLLGAAVLARLPRQAILYNLEQIDPASPLPPSRLLAFRGWRIWDFSLSNQAIWKSLGMEAAVVPIGAYPGLDRISTGVVQDIDVLFYGALNPRRKAMLTRIAEAGLRTAVCDRVFGQALDRTIARAKVVLNLHFYPAAVLETVRLSYLLANGRAVVSERSPRTEVPREYEDAVSWAVYDDLAAACFRLANDAERRAALGIAGRAAMKRLPIVPILQGALAQAGLHAADAAYAA